MLNSLLRVELFLLSADAELKNDFFDFTNLLVRFVHASMQYPCSKVDGPTEGIFHRASSLRSLSYKHGTHQDYTIGRNCGKRSSGQFREK